MHIISITLTIAFTLLAALHVVWALGYMKNSRAFIPSVDGLPLFTPRPVATFAVALVLMGFASVSLALGFSGKVPTHYLPYMKTGGKVIGIILIVRAVGEFKYAGFFKRIKGTLFATYDTWLYSPFCLVSGLGFLYLAKFS